MAKPKSEEKRNAIMAAATRIVATQGLGAPTAVIAQEAGVANGTLFTYFETKTDLLNELYLELKTEMATAALDGLPIKADLRKQAFHIWKGSMGWGVADPDKRRAFAQLCVSDEITAATRAEGHKVMIPVADVMERIRADGPMRNASMTFVVAVMDALAETTMDFMIRDPANAEKHCKTGFDALWRAIA
jgi:AcrR family transcriptional regulator